MGEENNKNNTSQPDLVTSNPPPSPPIDESSTNRQQQPPPVIGILKNSPTREKKSLTEDLTNMERVPVDEPPMIRKEAYLTHPAEEKNSERPKELSLDKGENIVVESARDFLIQKRSSLVHTPDIARVFTSGNSSNTEEEADLHEFQKIQLRHVENNAGGILSPDIMRKVSGMMSDITEIISSTDAKEKKLERTVSKDVIVELTPGPVVDIKPNKKLENSSVSQMKNKSETKNKIIEKKTKSTNESSSSPVTSAKSKESKIIKKNVNEKKSTKSSAIKNTSKVVKSSSLSSDNNKKNQNIKDSSSSAAAAKINAESVKKNDETTKPNVKGGFLAPTRSWLSHMGDQVDIKSRTPSPHLGKKGSVTPTIPRKRPENSPIVKRRSTSTDKKEQPLKRTDSLRSTTSDSSKNKSRLNRTGSLKASVKKKSINNDKDESTTTTGKISSSLPPTSSGTPKKVPPPTLPKPIMTNNITEKNNEKNNGIEKNSIKATSVIEKFEKGNDEKSSEKKSILGQNESSIRKSSTSKVSSKASVSHQRKSSFNSKISSSVEQSASTSSVRKTSIKSRKTSINQAKNENVESVTNIGNSAEKYKTTMVVRLHPGQSRKLSNCSTTTESYETETHRKSLVTNIGSGTHYSAQIHDTDCETTDRCCASGLEITFEALPQTIDIKLISEEETKSSSQDSAAAAVGSKSDLSISTENIDGIESKVNKTRQ